MVFHCRCFSFSLQEDEEIGYENRTQTKSTTTFYTAASDFNRSVPDSHTKSSEISNRVEKPSNLRVFTFAELKAATDNFSRASNIGEDGFVSVYKGVIKSLDHPFDEIQVAVKFPRLSMTLEEWEPEIKVVGMVEHPNLVKLIGYYVEDKGNVFGMQLLLVYEYMVHRSVSDHLYLQSESPLSGNTRLKVARDVARGLTYLHEEMNFEVILRDFKTSNILLDDQMNVKIADFAFARLRPQQQYTSSSLFVGTMAYAAPENISTGRYTSKSDVWSYGVFLNELITGRRPLDKTRLGKARKLLERVNRYTESIRSHKIIDPRLPLKSAQKLSHIANCCLRKDPNSRPKMSEVLD